MADPDVFQAYATITIKNTLKTPAVNEKRIKEALEAVSVEGTEKVEFQFSDKEAA